MIAINSDKYCQTAIVLKIVSNEEAFSWSDQEIYGLLVMRVLQHLEEPYD